MKTDRQDAEDAKQQGWGLIRRTSFHLLVSLAALAPWRLRSR